MDYQQQQQQQQYQQQQQMQPNPYEGQPQQQPIQQEYTQGAAVQNQEWQASLCSCSPIDSCCLAYWLPCIRTSPSHLLTHASRRRRLFSSLINYD